MSAPFVSRKVHGINPQLKWLGAMVLTLAVMAMSSPAQAQTGIVLDKYYDTPMQGGSSVMEDLATLLSPFVKAAPTTTASAGQQIFGGVTYLMPLEQAKTTLGISSRTPSRTMMACAGFPQKSLFSYSFEGAFEGHFNQCVLVTDQASQVVCISLVADSPKEDLVSSMYGKADWHTYNFVLARNKSLTRLEINHRVTYLREKKDQWQLYEPADPPPPAGQTSVVRVDTCLTDPGTRNGYRTSPRKALEASRLYLPKPMMELILHCIQKAKR